MYVYVRMYLYVSIYYVYMYAGNHENCVCIIIYVYILGALIYSDDDYCISYIVTMVDVRSCTRPPRSPTHPPESMYAASTIVFYIVLYVCIII